MLLRLVSSLLVSISLTIPFVMSEDSASHASNSSNLGYTSAIRSPQELLDVDNYPKAPSGLSLEQVYVYIRHGERTPVSVRMSSAPASLPEHWMMCKSARTFQASVAQFVPEINYRESSTNSFLPIKKVVERADGSSADGECLLGELTDVGKMSTYNYGVALRKLYVEKLGFLSDTLGDSRTTYFRSTNVPRTIESLNQVIHGLYPSSKVRLGISPQILIRNGKDENLIGNTASCERLGTLLISFARAAASTFNHTLQSLDKKISKYIDGNPVRLDGRPRASGILDTIRACEAHGIPVPAEFKEKEVMGLIENAVVNEWFSDKTNEVRRLGMGRLLSELAQKMESKAVNGDGVFTKILVHSTHDVGLAAICSTLDVFDEKWPPFTASVTFELFSKKQHEEGYSYLQNIIGSLSSLKRTTPSEHFVRMRYKNTNMVLPLCAEEGKHLPGHPEFCTLAAFSERVKELTPSDWSVECKSAAA